MGNASGDYLCQSCMSVIIRKGIIWYISKTLTAGRICLYFLISHLIYKSDSEKDDMKMFHYVLWSKVFTRKSFDVSVKLDVRTFFDEENPSAFESLNEFKCK